MEIFVFFRQTYNELTAADFEPAMITALSMHVQNLVAISYPEKEFQRNEIAIGCEWRLERR